MSSEGFKETKIGLIPEDWEIKKIGDICQQVRNSFNPNDNDIRPYIGLEHINEGSLTLNGVGSSSEVKSGKLVFQNGQILFGKLRPYFRKVYRPDFDGVCSTDILVIDKKEDNDNRFLFYFFANPLIIDIATQSSEGTKMPRASWNYLIDLEFPFPDFNEQKAIGKFLSSIDQKIYLNHQMNQTLEAMCQAIFRHWFVHFEFPNSERRPYKSSGGEMVDSELGEIPKGWDVQEIGNTIETTGGGTPSTKKEEYWENGDIQWFSPRDITANKQMFITDSEKKNHQKRLKK
jgi:type I restriction enzyme S subunit